MSANAICGAKRRGKPWRTTIAGSEPIASPDLVNRDFNASAARRVDRDGVLIHHSDRGSQYTSAQFSNALTDHGVLASLGSVGIDNHHRLHSSLGDVPPSAPRDYAITRTFDLSSSLD